MISRQRRESILAKRREFGQRAQIRRHQSLLVKPVIQEAGLRAVRVMLGDGAAQASADGGWAFVSRPKNIGFTVWEGQSPYSMTVPIMLDGFVDDESQEAEWEALRRIFRVPVGLDRQPSPVSLVGAVPLAERLTWVISDLQTTQELRSVQDGHRIRIEANLELMQYVEADVIVGVQASPAKAAAERAPQAAAPPQTRVYVVKRGDTLVKIAQATLGTYKRWPEIAKLNGIRDPRKLQVGQRLKLPA